MKTWIKVWLALVMLVACGGSGQTPAQAERRCFTLTNRPSWMAPAPYGLGEVRVNGVVVLSETMEICDE